MLALLLLTAALGSGCSTLNFAYSMAPTVLGVMADNYLDLDGEQETWLKERIIVLREWIRVNHLAETGKLLQEASSRVDRPVTLDDVQWFTTEGRRRWKAVGTRIAVDMAEVAPRLNADNIAALKKKFARNNAEYTKDTINARPEKQREKRLERVKENAERWYGSFDDTQMERIKAMSEALPMHYRSVLEDRIRRQTALLTLLTGLMD